MSQASIAPKPLADSESRFGFDTKIAVYGFEEPFHLDTTTQIPTIDPDYVLNRELTRAILAGFSFNRRVMIHGPHGSGKSTHIEQIAARLNWPCQRINLDGQVSRLDMVGHDILTTNKAGTQITEFRDGMLTQALSRPIALVLDEYDAARPDVLFVLQRLLEENGVLNLYEHERVVTPHPAFRIFATANTAGQGDATGVYHGTQLLNQGQLDRWHIMARLDYLAADDEQRVVMGRLQRAMKTHGTDLRLAVDEMPIEQMVRLANLVRRAYGEGKITNVLSPRTVLAWAETAAIIGDIEEAFRLSFLHRCETHEQISVDDLYYEVFAVHLNQPTAPAGIP